MHRPFAFAAGGNLGAFAALVLVVVGCSSSSPSTTSSTSAQTGTRACTYPANAKAGTSASGMGCFAGPRSELSGE